MDDTIEITYSVMGFEDIGETTFDMEVSERIFEELEEAEEEGEILDSDYISEEFPRIHKKIIRAIKENMEEEGLDPEDGMVEKRLPWGAITKDYDPDLSYANMAEYADDDEDDIEYTVNLY